MVWYIAERCYSTKMTAKSKDVHSVLHRRWYGRIFMHTVHIPCVFSLGYFEYPINTNAVQTVLILYSVQCIM